MQILKKLGPGILVSAAFIGPGTVTTSTLAGANYGYALIWALVFATVATIALQEMSARLGTVSQAGLGQGLLSVFARSIFKWPLLGLMLVAMYLGNAAYEGGNLAGAALGVTAVFGDSETIRMSALAAISSVALIILLTGSYQRIERILIGLVMLMALAFSATFFVVQPDLLALLTGSLTPSLPDGDSVLTVAALIGTTIVPYNLFLHAAASRTRWRGAEDLPSARVDTFFSIGLGGLIAIFIVATAASGIFAKGLNVANAADMALQLQPLFGSSSTLLLGVGLFAAGLSSAITAPLATGYALSEIFGLDQQQHTMQFKLICVSVLLFGAVVAMSGIKPLSLIVAAQIANGLLLPIVALFLLYAVNNKNIMGTHTNGFLSNIFGVVIVCLTVGLGLKAVITALGKM